MKVKTVAQVYETSDYKLFHRLECNRTVSENRLNKLIASIRVRRVMCPITVNRFFQIVDGQGRYEACKKMGLPIQYVFDPNAGIDDCRRMNHYNSKWSMGDFIASYAEGGNENYRRMQRVIDRTGLSYSAVTRIAQKGKSRAADKNIESGDVIFTTRDEEKSYAIWQFIEKLKEALCITRRVSETFVRGVIVIFSIGEFDQERMLRNAQRCRSNFVQMSGLEDMLAEFSRVYNYRQKGELTYFEDYMRNKGANVRDYTKRKNEKGNVSTLRDYIK